MSIFVDENTKVIYQGLTGSQGRMYGLLNQASSWAGTPSVMATMNVTPPSAASMTAERTPGAGMKMQLAVAPVASTASPTDA